MLRQKKMQLQRSAITQPLNLFLSSLVQLQPPPPSKNSGPVTRPKGRNRACLQEIKNTQNLSRLASQESRCSSNSKLGVDSGKELGGSKWKQQEVLLERLSQLMKNEELPVPAGHPSHPKKPFERPRTSLSQPYRTSLDHSIVCQSKFVFHLSNADEDAPPPAPLPSRISTSRALMHYSTVYRNASGERFKVRRDRSLPRNSVRLEAQKIVLQQKQRKERTCGNNSTDKVAFSERPHRRKAKNPKDRYADQQQFQLNGWDYFQ